MRLLVFVIALSPAVKKAYAGVGQDEVLALVEGALHQIGIVHIQNTVLHSVMVFVKDVANRLTARLVWRDVHASVVVVAADNIRNRGVALKAHGVLDALRNQRRTDKAAGAKLAHANALREISVLIGQRHLSARIAHIGIIDRRLRLWQTEYPARRLWHAAGWWCLR